MLYRRFGKRLLDGTVALLGLAVLWPVLVAVGLLLWGAHRSSPFFKQRRPGLHGAIFTIVKFKTMNDTRATDGTLLPDAQRLTRIGRWVRAASLDELPQLWNVLVGDMSLVGPRPLLVQYLPLYSPEQARRHEVRPGITGWAQVHGRNTLSWEEKFAYDVWYVEHYSLKTDLKIILLTILKVLKREGISAQGQATTEPFRGSTERSVVLNEEHKIAKS